LSALIGSTERWPGLTRLELAVCMDYKPIVAPYRKSGFGTEAPTG